MLESRMRSYLPSTSTGYFKTRRLRFSIPSPRLPRAAVPLKAGEQRADGRIRLAGDAFEPQIDVRAGLHGIPQERIVRTGGGREHAAELPVLQLQRAGHRRRTLAGALRFAHEQHIAERLAERGDDQLGRRFGKHQTFEDGPRTAVLPGGDGGAHIEDVEAAMKGMLDPVYEEKVIGHAEVRQLFKASGVGTIAGSYVLDGIFQRNCKVRITREGEQVFEGELASLKRFKDDVKEVKAGYECGLVFDGFNDVKEEDKVEAYIMVEVPR